MYNKRIRTVCIYGNAPLKWFDDGGGLAIKPGVFQSVSVVLDYWTGESKLYRNVTPSSVNRLIEASQKCLPKALARNTRSSDFDGYYEYTCPHCGGEL